MNNKISSNEFSWVGSSKHWVDEISLNNTGCVTVGRFGGNSAAGQYKNKDGCLVWASEKGDWEFCMILDAHHSAESAELVLAAVADLKMPLHESLELPVQQAFGGISHLLLTMFSSPSFKQACRNVQGETAVLIAVRKEKFLWWLSIGDCLLYVFHPELQALGEAQQNQRSFYEWVGQANAFELPVPCFSTGTKELRKGRNQLFMTTDGLVECPGTSFSNPVEIEKVFETNSNAQGVQLLLETIQQNGVRDSTTILSWHIDVESNSTRPSDE